MSSPASSPDASHSATALLWQRRNAAVSAAVGHASPFFADRARNALVWDVEGRRLIDFAGGIGTLNTGHLHPAIVKAVEHQLSRFSHTAFSVLPYESYVALAERLNALAPVRAPVKSMFVTTGAEAVENAVKFARAFTRRPGLVAFRGAFHGRTNLTMALNGKLRPYKASFGPFPGDIFHVAYPQGPNGGSAHQSLSELEECFNVDLEPERCAAILVEPVQGEGGFYVTPPELLEGIRALCDRHGIVMIADEVQSGFARTGRMFAIEHSGVQPDLITIAKSLSGGFPLAGVIGRAELMDAPASNGVGGTFAGSPIGCAAALAVLDVIEKENLLHRSEQIGQRIQMRLQGVAQHHNAIPIGDIRGLGAMVAFELVTSRQAHVPDPNRTRAVVSAAQERGLILLSCGYFGNVIRILVPLTIENDVLEQGLGILEEVLTQS